MAQAINQDAGIVKRVLRLFDELARADEQGILLMFAKVKGKCHAESILSVIQHRAWMEQDSFGMTSQCGTRTVSNY